MSLKLIGELIGIVAIFESFFIYLSNRRKHIIFLKCISVFFLTYLLNIKYDKEHPIKVKIYDIKNPVILP